MSAAKPTTRMENWINYRIRIVLPEKRTIVGVFLAFDKYMNMVMSDCEEFRYLKTDKPGEEREVKRTLGKLNSYTKFKPREEREVKRTLGMVVIRGENIRNMSVEAAPQNMPKMQGIQAGPGKAQVAGRGASMPGAAGLSAPMRGVGGPAQAQMQPRGI